MINVPLRALAAFLALSVLAACGQQEKAKEEFPVIDAPVLNSQIGPRGAAGISTALAMDVAAIEAASPGYSVVEVEDQIEGQSFRAITLSAGDEEVFRVLPSADGAHIHSIVTRSTQARGPLGELVGASTLDVVPAAQQAFCASELIDNEPGFACSTAEDGNFWRVFKLPNVYDGPSAPFDAIDPEIAYISVLAEMRWVAPPPAQ